MKKIELTPITSADVTNARGDRYVRLDKYKRLTLSSAVRNDLSIYGIPARLYISFDVANKAIGIVKADQVTVVPNAVELKMSVRGYVHAPYILDKFGLSVDDAPYRFDYVGKLDSQGVSWQGFRLGAE